MGDPHVVPNLYDFSSEHKIFLNNVGNLTVAAWWPLHSIIIIIIIINNIIIVTGFQQLFD